ncbi:MAG: di-trans,poly-cis-decaprenylcistransferase [Holosporaceae bacterium]|jgi:undecaprenyl diphosphate synthase|nr:di-trans,poly-cis-decaprenylcistransferase [Holosporaceae bacterium]
MSGSLKHIAFILDGNRRWAKKRGLPSLIGHQNGYERTKEITPLLPKYGIEFVTYYTFSIENWKRSEEEVEYLMNLLRDFCSLKDYAMQHGIRMKVIGDLERLAPDILEKIRKLEDYTKRNTILTAVIAISYGGRDEIVRAVRKIIPDILEKKMNVSELNEETLASYLDTSGIPYPDAVVRTSENRLSNFLMWQMAYSEIFFIDKLWPDFNEEDLQNIIAEFSRRERRYGK